MRKFHNYKIQWKSVFSLVSFGNKQSLATGRLKIPDDVLTLATRTNPSLPGWSSTMRASSHFNGGRLSSRTRTRSPMLRFLRELSHLVRCWRLLRYSLDQRVQKCCNLCWTSCHLERRLTGTVCKSGSTGAVITSPIKKWPGVSAERSLGSEDNGEFRIRYWSGI